MYRQGSGNDMGPILDLIQSTPRYSRSVTASVSVRAVSLVLGSAFLYVLASGSAALSQAVAQTAAETRAQPQGDGAAIALETIEVQGEGARGPDNSIVARRSLTGAKTDTSLLETPQAVNVVTRRQMEQQGSNTVAQALRYTPGVMAEPNGNDIRYDWLYIRGFNTYGTVWLDGLAMPGDPSNYATPGMNPYALERIEVIKGPASVLYGRTIPGGLVNYVSKRPRNTPHREIEIGTSAFGGLQTSVDFGGPVGTDFAYRFAGQWRNMGAQVDKERDRQIMLAPSLTWRPDTATELTLYGYYQKDDPKNFSPRFYPAYGTLLPNAFGRIPRDTYFGNTGANEFNREFYTAGYEFSHKFTENVTFRQNLRYGHSRQDMYLALVNPAFAYQRDGHTLNRVSGASDDWLSTFSVDNQLETKFQTGAFGHTLLFGLDYNRTASDRQFGNTAAGVPAFDLLNPDYRKALIPYPAYGTSVNQRQEQLGVYAQDQIRYGRWVGTFGLRYDITEATTINRVAKINPVTTNDANHLSGRAGLSYQFDNGVAPYVAYSTAFLPTMGVDALGAPFKPQVAEQYEVGVKYAPTGARGHITLSLFNLNVDHALTPSAIVAGQIGYVQSGKQRVRGVEVEGKYELASGFDVIGSYAFSASKIVESNDPIERGETMLRLPRHQASLWLRHRSSLIPGLALSAGVRATSAYQSDAKYLPELRIPGRALVDLGLEYDIGELRPELKGAKFQVNVSNLFDKVYVSHCLNTTGGSCNYGFGRSITASLKYAW